ncbi:MAG: hypothetical protein BGP09_21620 [Rhizobium sp. 60-20]|nr:MAG: hypothetical protein BGP09_21620 [Rhizobium sp. 60-20]
MQIALSSQPASILSDVGLMQDNESKNKIATECAAVGNSNSLSSSTSSLQSPLAISALDKAATRTSFNYSGPNLAVVTATNDKAIASGLSGGYNPNDPNFMNAANAIAGARYEGRLTGEVTSDFLSNVQNYHNLSDAIVQGMQARLSSIAVSTSDQAGSASL